MNKRKQALVKQYAKNRISMMLEDLSENLDEYANEFYTQREMNHPNFDERLAMEVLYESIKNEIKKQLK